MAKQLTGTNMLDAQGLCCPLDGSPLINKARSLVCQQGHSFDVAKQGYCNLLPVQHKRSSDPGDSKEMVAARTSLLDSGCYQPIAMAVVRQLKAQLTDLDDNAIRIADAGCGDGYYLEQLAQQLSQSDVGQIDCIGYDISKWAVLAACRRNKAIRWLVASSKNIPIVDNYLDAMLCMFGFPVYSEFARSIKTGGLLVMVDAGPDHLIELRQSLYDDIKPHRPWSGVVAGENGFEQVESTQSVRFKVDLEQAQLHNLLLMTPHFFRASQQAKNQLAELTKLSVTIDAQIRILRLMEPTNE